ncbi:hypothetical protein NDU88_004043 [Pleurodeles waltl]|uniref:Uncharacterized protein n=1 Tax=Pleurodeles waltl TaxID=8319 RepID=A0AAV7KY91_PLEWA|nr:hypothetical protein NDU88_004043 [Pleurodeles waltl]
MSMMRHHVLITMNSEAVIGSFSVVVEDTIDERYKQLPPEKQSSSSSCKGFALVPSLSPPDGPNLTSKFHVLACSAELHTEEQSRRRERAIRGCKSCARCWKAVARMPSRGKARAGSPRIRNSSGGCRARGEAKTTCQQCPEAGDSTAGYSEEESRVGVRLTVTNKNAGHKETGDVVRDGRKSKCPNHKARYVLRSIRTRDPWELGTSEKESSDPSIPSSITKKSVPAKNVSMRKEGRGKPRKPEGMLKMTTSVNMYFKVVPSTVIMSKSEAACEERPQEELQVMSTMVEVFPKTVGHEEDKVGPPGMGG